MCGGSSLFLKSACLQSIPSGGPHVLGSNVFRSICPSFALFPNSLNIVYDGGPSVIVLGQVSAFTVRNPWSVGPQSVGPRRIPTFIV